MATTTTVRPKLADIYWDWEAEGRTVSPPSLGGIVAVAAKCNWGPTNVVTGILTEDKLYTYFGDSDTDLHRVTRDAFKGHGYGGKGGASAVLAVRQATTGAAKGSKVLKNIAGTPADALTLTGKYPGTRINTFRLTVQAGAVAGTNELLILDGSLVVERYPHPVAGLQQLADDINRLSAWLDATVNVDGVALAPVSAVAVTGGADGEALTGVEWAATFASLDRHRWAGFAAYGLTDTAIRAALVAWIRARNALGVRCWGITGGASGEVLATAVARSRAINHWDVLNLGRGTLHLTDEDRDVSTAEFVGRYAGARAWRGEARGDVYVRFGDVEILDGPTLAEQEQALDGGVIVFSRDTFPDAPVFIREAVTTYTDDSQSPRDDEGNKTRPVDLYRVVKDIAIQHGIENEVGDWARSGDVIGDQPVDDKTRELVLGRYRIAYQTRQTARVVQSGWTVKLAGPVSDDDDFIECLHGFHPTRALRQLFNVARIG